MRNIIVVECISTGKNFIGDIINRGYNPVVLDLKDSDTEDGKRFGEHVREEYKLIPYEFDILFLKVLDLGIAYTALASVLGYLVGAIDSFHIPI